MKKILVYLIRRGDQSTMLNNKVHLEILTKFNELKGTVIIGKSGIKGERSDQRILPDNFVSEEHMLHDLIRGFYKPKGSPFILSYQATEAEKNYGKQIIWNEKSSLDFERIEIIPPSGAKDNRKLSDITAARYNLKQQMPIGILHKIKKGINVVLGLGMIIEEDKDGKFIVVPYNMMPLNESATIDVAASEDEVTEGLVIAKKRKGQSKFKNYLLSRYSNCALCDVSSQYTIASHIKPWSLSTNSERININNGLLLCPNHDYLFDSGWISFDTNGKIILSKKMEESEFFKFNIDLNAKIEIYESMKEFIIFHNTYVFKP